MAKLIPWIPLSCILTAKDKSEGRCLKNKQEVKIDAVEACPGRTSPGMKPSVWGCIFVTCLFYLVPDWLAVVLLTAAVDHDSQLLRFIRLLQRSDAHCWNACLGDLPPVKSLGWFSSSCWRATHLILPVPLPVYLLRPGTFSPASVKPVTLYLLNLELFPLSWASTQDLPDPVFMHS